MLVSTMTRAFSPCSRHFADNRHWSQINEVFGSSSQTVYHAGHTSPRGSPPLRLDQ
jgi:hypothetical protein